MKFKHLLMFTTLLFTMSCSTYVSTTNNSWNINSDGYGDCKARQLSNYILPNIPDISNKETDYEIIDELVEHIRVLRKDLNSLIKECPN